MAPRNILLDAWSAISHKAPLRDEARDRAKHWTPRDWVPEADRRRLNAYMVLAAYEANISRHFLSTDDKDEEGENREYGDAALIIDQVLAALLGEEQNVVVAGAEDYDPDMEDPTIPPEDFDEAAAGGPYEPSEEDLQAWAENLEAKVLAEREDFLRTWATTTHLGLRVVDSERNAVQFGDAVYLLGWDDVKHRATCAVMDPGHYFPVLPDSIDQYDYPTRVHFAWELPAEDFDDKLPRVRRITYEIKPLQQTVRVDPETGDVTIEDPDNARLVDEKWVREYAYDDKTAEDYKPSGVACYLSDAMWKLDSVDEAVGYDDLALKNAEWRIDDDGQPVRDVDLGIDFIPVIHVPNTPPGGDHFGQSSLAKVLQILDDLQNADTDAQAASATTGNPIIGISGDLVVHPAGEDPTANPGQVGVKNRYVVKGGEVWTLGKDGKLHVVDTSTQLAAQREYVISLLDRLSINSRLPAVVLGRMDASEAPSGFAMTLSFGPLTAMIRQMRLTRAVKYPLLLKMTQRLYQVNGKLADGPTPDADLRFGNYLPTDADAILQRVASGVSGGVLSLETGLKMLVEAGFPIADVAEEILAIQRRDFEGANRLADAVGVVDLVREYLGLPPAPPTPATAAPPPGGVPPVPGAEPPVEEQQPPEDTPPAPE